MKNNIIEERIIQILQAVLPVITGIILALIWLPRVIFLALIVVYAYISVGSFLASLSYIINKSHYKNHNPMICIVDTVAIVFCWPLYLAIFPGFVAGMVKNMLEK